MRELPKQISDEELLAGLEAYLEQIPAGSKEFEALCTLRLNIELRRQNQRIMQELHLARETNRFLRNFNLARRRA